MKKTYKFMMRGSEWTLKFVKQLDNAEWGGRCVHGEQMVEVLDGLEGTLRLNAILHELRHAFDEGFASEELVEEFGSCMSVILYFGLGYRQALMDGRASGNAGRPGKAASPISTFMPIIIAGETWKLFFDKSLKLGDGLCRHDLKAIAISDSLTGKRRLEVILRELFHAFDRGYITNSLVEWFSKDVADLLFDSLRYRQRADKGLIQLLSQKGTTGKAGRQRKSKNRRHLEKAR